MPRFLISFVDGAMDHISAEDLPQVEVETRAVVREAKAAGVWIFGAGLARQVATTVDGEGAVTDGPGPDVGTPPGGFSIIEVADRGEAHAWAARIAAACRCDQEVRELLHDPES